MTPTDRAVRRAALLLMDFHSAVVDNHGEAGRRAVDAAASALDHARRRHLPIFHVLPHYRPGYPELPSGPPFDEVKAAGLFCEPAAAAGIAAQLAPRRDEPVIPKCRYSPFFANDLLHLLRMRNVQTLVLAGIATSGVVLSAVRDAWDRDYRIVVLGDACADRDPGAERVLLEKVIARQASILSVGRWIDSDDADSAG